MRFSLLLCVLLVLVSCTYKPLISVPLNPEQSLLFAEFKRPGLYGSQVETYVATPAPFALLVTELSYRLWYKVFLWAEKERGYVFNNAGAEGSRGNQGAPPKEIPDQDVWETTVQGVKAKDVGLLSKSAQYRKKYPLQIGQPVSQVSWGDAVIWCNALSEYLSFSTENQREPVYRNLDGGILRSADVANKGQLQRKSRANGFRLPTEGEWELASRWLNGQQWLAGDWAAGAFGDFSSLKATHQVAWYGGNSGGNSWPVASRKPTAVGLYDMSGNLAEWVEDIFQPTPESLLNLMQRPKSPSLPFRTIKGGAYLSPPRELQVAGRLPALPEQAHKSIGLRLAFWLE